MHPFQHGGSILKDFQLESGIYGSSSPEVVLTTSAESPIYTLFSVTATFSKPVTGFVLGDITVTNGVASNFAGSGAMYTFDVTPSAIGTTTVQIGAAVCTDLAGNPNTASNTLSYSAIGTGLAHWYNPDSLSRLFQDSAMTTPVVNTGDPVGAWVDQIVAADEVAQAVTAAKPTYRATVAALNNKPALQFDGGDWLQGAWSALIAQPITYFCVSQFTNLTGIKVIWDGDDATNRNEVYSTSGSLGMYAGSAITGVAAMTNVAIRVAEFNGINSNLYVNGASAITGDPGAAGIDGLTLGSFYGVSSGYFVGYIAEHLTYVGTLTAAQKNIVQTYLAAKYNITVTPFS